MRRSGGTITEMFKTALRQQQLKRRLKAAATWVNAKHDVEGLCREMPHRMHDLVHVAKGGRLDK